VYYPSPGAAASDARTRDPREVFARELPECVRSGTESQSALPSLRSLRWLARSVSGRGSSSSGRSNLSGGSNWGSDGDVKVEITDDWKRRNSTREGRGLPPPSPAPHIAKGAPAPLRISKRQGETIAKGHKNYELMLNLQLGIRCISFP
jgi:1-phosphatidylinositol-4-phosphate 5-kinase